jgi:hypothetical protein
VLKTRDLALRSFPKMFLLGRVGYFSRSLAVTLLP